MRFERPTLVGTAVFVGCVLVFVLAGPVWGWRVVGMVSLVGALRALGKGRVCVGIEGHEPYFYLTGFAARGAAFLGVLIALFLIFFAPAVVAFGRP